MLVLSRKKGEGLWLGRGIRVRVLRVAGSRVQLGVEAPGHVQVLRDELESRSADFPARGRHKAPNRSES